ncbi:zinc-dependent alcohol dehydrogenase family protein [Mesorhizobium sp. CU2]|uniref:zinc-dependent alcohol dehydrogenase family protein n=1 Tax=unclassified Mesorhizobium TaxID=325217 RepID=UPI00112B07DB|nr:MULTISPECIES: zinc-dependent alcohol dehydrogenase family protein [unclassified Mesorhizobium]TPN81114.1 zinc-dependent alcohol dehydrogenase family protein [Mesorhizobium sp. CU3]TPO17088.1 zinc-dependent alcohol dehydrogenase family protein [Mesorhizobium sp. CU2]
MKAIVYEAFSGAPTISTVPDPEVTPGGAVIAVGATGVCRSDWHAWVGHDPSIVLPHVPGHEFAGTVVATGKDVARWAIGDRVTMPFSSGCGHCHQCRTGNQHICDVPFSPGFSHWGSFAQYVAVEQADLNLVKLPDSLEFQAAASLGCRFVTSFRAVVEQGRLKPGQWLAVYGCGGVGLSAIMIGHALGAQIVAVDVASEKLTLAKSLGANVCLNANDFADVAAAVAETTGGGAHVSMDALGNKVTCFNSIKSLRKRGRHIQVGLTVGSQSLPPIPMEDVIVRELEIYGSLGMQSHAYEPMFGMIGRGLLPVHRLIGATTNFTGAISALVSMDRADSPGVTVVTDFS